MGYNFNFGEGNRRDCLELNELRKVKCDECGKFIYRGERFAEICSGRKWARICVICLKKLSELIAEKDLEFRNKILIADKKEQNILIKEKLEKEQIAEKLCEEVK